MAIVAGRSGSLATRGCRAPDLELGHPLHTLAGTDGQSPSRSAPRHTGAKEILPLLLKVWRVRKREGTREPTLVVAIVARSLRVV